MAFLYKTKIIVSGSIVELYNYSKKRVCGYTTFKKKNLSVREDLDDSKRSKQSNARSAVGIRALVNSNPDLDRFLTLTWAKNQKDLSKSNYEFKKFVLRIRYIEPNFKYVCIVEFQKRGAIHYHLVCNSHLKNFQIAKLWKHGFTKSPLVKDVRNLGAYFAKHSFKNDKIECKNLAGRKKFFCSRLLLRPIVYIRPSDTVVFNEKYLSGCIPFFEKVFSGNNLTIKYKQFKIE